MIRRTTTTMVRADSAKIPTNKIETHRQKAKQTIKDANERRIAFEKSTLEKLTALQTDLKEIATDDIAFMKSMLNKSDVRYQKKKTLRHCFATGLV